MSELDKQLNNLMNTVITDPSQGGENNTLDESTEDTVSQDNEDQKEKDIRIPLERFKSVNEQKKMLQEQLEREREINEALLKAQSNNSEQAVSLPAEYVELLGDDEAAQKFYKVIEKLTDEKKNQALQEFFEKQKEMQMQEDSEINREIERLNEDLQRIEDEKGIKFLGDSDKAQRNRNELFDIVEEYSYGEDIMPLDKAFDIWQAKRSKTNQKNINTSEYLDMSGRKSNEDKMIQTSWENLYDIFKSKN